LTERGVSSETEILTIEIATLTELLTVHEEQAVRQYELIRKQQETLEERAALLAATVASLAEIQRVMPGALFTFDRGGVIRSVNDAAKVLLGFTEHELVGALLAPRFDAGGDHMFAELEKLDAEQRTLRRETMLISSTGERIPAFVSAALCANGTAPKTLAVCVAIDIRDRKRLEMELRQAQKLESVGRLAAGVAHEINTPVQFVSDSLHFLDEASKDLIVIIDKLQQVRRSMNAGTPWTEAASSADAAEIAADLPFLLENVPMAFERCLDGMGRIATIVRSMKEFAHPDSKEMMEVDVNRAIESTLTIARNEYKHVAELETDFGDLPQVRCYVGELNQAVLNIVVNAAHAIADLVEGTDRLGRIWVQTRKDGDDVVIRIADTGGGIPEAIRDRVFDPFFTTKAVGKGTGQGLSVARSVVVDKHKGALSIESEVGKGTTFSIRLPIAGDSMSRQ
jgi:two-component system NtrC family sensor kinase